MNEKLTVSRIIRQICEEICEKYCKWPEKWDPAEHDGAELFESEICENCPLNKLE